MFEDDKNFRESIQMLLDGSDDIYVASAFPHANEAWKRVREYQPDVILMDIEMPGTDGIEALNTITEKATQQKIMMLTSFDDEHRIFAAICAGASGYALKGDIDNLEQGIRDVHNGGGHFSAAIAMRVIKMLQHPLVTKQNTYISLTNQETKVLEKMVDGKSRKMIAADLTISPLTINGYYKEIYRKLHVNSAQEAVREAIVRRLV